MGGSREFPALKMWGPVPLRLLKLHPVDCSWMDFGGGGGSPPPPRTPAKTPISTPVSTMRGKERGCYAKQASSSEGGVGGFLHNNPLTQNPVPEARRDTRQVNEVIYAALQETTERVTGGGKSAGTYSPMVGCCDGIAVLKPPPQHGTARRKREQHSTRPRRRNTKKTRRSTAASIKRARHPSATAHHKPCTAKQEETVRGGGGRVVLTMALTMACRPRGVHSRLGIQGRGFPWGLVGYTPPKQMDAPGYRSPQDAQQGPCAFSLVIQF